MLKLHEVSTFSMAMCWQSPSNDELRLKISKVGTSKVSIKSWTLTASTGGRRCWKLDCSNGAGPASKNCISRTPIKKHLSLDKLVNRACRSSTFKWFWSESSMSTCNAMTGAPFARELSKCSRMRSWSSLEQKSKRDFPDKPPNVRSNNPESCGESSIKVKVSSAGTTAS